MTQPLLSDKELRTVILNFDKSRGETGRDYVEGAITRQQAYTEFEDDIQSILTLIKQREEQVAREARIDELNYVKDKLTRFGMDTIDPNDIATRITQLTTNHKGDQ